MYESNYYCVFSVGGEGRTMHDCHYDDVIMIMLASQITSLTIVYSIVYSGVNQRKHQSSASLAFVREIHRGPVNFPHKWPVTQKMFPFDDVIMVYKQIIGTECRNKLEEIFNDSCVCHNLDIDLMLKSYMDMLINTRRHYNYNSYDSVLKYLRLRHLDLVSIYRLSFQVHCKDEIVVRPSYLYNENYRPLLVDLSAQNLVLRAHVILVGLRPALEGFVVTMHEGACETGSQIPTA